MNKFFKRIGTTTTKFSYEAYIQHVNLNVDQVCSVKIIWKRGSHSIQTSRSKQFNQKTGQADFQESLFLEGTLYHSKKTNKFQEKISVFVIIMETQMGSKEIGQVQFDLSQLPNSEQTSKSYSLQLEKSLYKNATLKFNLICNKVGDANESQMNSHSNDQDNSKNYALYAKNENQFKNEVKDKNQLNKIIYQDENKIQKIEQQESRKLFQTKQIDLQQRKQDLLIKQQDLDDTKYVQKEKLEQKKQFLKLNIQVEKEYDEKKTNDKQDRVDMDDNHFKQNTSIKHQQKDQKLQPYTRSSIKTLTQILPQQKLTQKQNEQQNSLNSTSTSNNSKNNVYMTNKKEQDENPSIELKRDLIKNNKNSQSNENQVVDKKQIDNLSTQDNCNNLNSDQNNYNDENYVKNIEQDIYDMQSSDKNISDVSTENSPSDKKYDFVQNRFIGEGSNEQDELSYFDALNSSKSINLLEDQIFQQEQKTVESQFDHQRKNEIQNQNEENKKQYQEMSEQSNGQINMSLILIENKKLKAKVQQLNDSISKLQGEIIQANSNKQQLETKHKHVVNDYKNLMKENQQNKDILEQLQDEKSSSSSYNKVFEHENKTRLEKITCQYEEINQLRNDQAKQESENFKLQKKIQELELTVNTIKEQVQNENLNVNVDIERETIIIKQKQEIQEIQKQLNEVKERLRNTEEDKQKTINKLTIIELDKRDIQTKLLKLQNDYDYSKQKSDGENEDHQKYLQIKDKEIQNLKNRILEILKKNNDQNDYEEDKDTIIQLEKNNSQLQEYIIKLESNINQIEKDQKEYQQSLNLIDQLNNEVKELKSNLNKQDKKFSVKLQNKEKEIEEKKMIIVELQSQIFELEQTNMFKSCNLDTNDHKYRELKKINQKIKEECQFEIQSLNILISELRKQLQQQSELYQNQENSNNKNDADYENEIARIYVENEQLQRKVKELNTKVQKLEQNGEFMKTFKALEIDHQKAKNELIQAKTEQANNDKRNRVQIQELETKLKETETTKQKLYKDLVIMKQKFGDALNVCIELGGSEIVEKIMRTES